MASTSHIAARRSIVATAIVLVVLLLLLAVLVAVNYALRQPAGFSGEGEGDRNFLFAIYGFEGDLLRRPSGVDFDAEGNIFVVDTGKRRVVVFDPDGGFQAVYGDPGQDLTELWNPIDVAVAADGRSWIVDKSQSKVVVYDVTRLPVDVITFPDEDPLSVEVADDELIITTESGVLVGTLDGELEIGYVERGQDPGQFDRPAGVAVGSDGTLYIADSLNYRVQALGTDGQVRWTYGDPIPPDQAIRFDDPTRKFGFPASIAADDAGFLYVVDGLNGEIQILEAGTGEYVETVGDVGHGDGFFYYPDSIAYHDGRLAVADKFNDRVQVFRVPAATTTFDRVLPFAPWLLLPLLLLLIPLIRRRSRVMTPSFVRNLESDRRGREVAAALKKVVATSALVEFAGEMFDEIKWIAREYDEERVADLIEKHGISREGAEALDIAMRMRGKRTLLSDDLALNAVAREYDIAPVTYDEILDTLGLRDEQVGESGDGSDE